MTIKNILLFALILFGFKAQAQDLMSLLDSAQQKSNDLVIATFKDTRLINTQTVETVGKRTLDFRVSHRFGAFNSGSYNLWGLDGPANIRLALEYSFEGRLMFGISRSSQEKMYDGFLKYRLLRQTTNNKMPLSLTLFSGMYYTNLKDPNAAANGFDKYQYTTDRMSFVHEIIIARKFSSNLSLQVAPFFVHFNLVETVYDKNDAYGVSASARMKFTKRQAITFEYAYRINDYSKSQTYYDSMGIGWEIETGGHVFSVHVTNSFGIADNQYLVHTDTKWDNMGIRLGFNISRVFTL